jgi:hypothetical protein
MLDWKSGQPVLIRSANVSDGLREGRLEKQAEREQMLRNGEQWQVLSPPAESYLRAKPAAADQPAAARGPAPGAAPRTETQLTLRTRKWLSPGIEELSAELENLVRDARNNSRIYHETVSQIKAADGDPAAALGLLKSEMKALQPQFQKLVTSLWMKTMEAALGVVVEEHEERGELQGVSEKVRAQMQQLQAALGPAAAKSAPAPTGNGASGAASNGAGEAPKETTPSTTAKG